MFGVSGYINLTDDLRISNDNITIAGQTSPGGVCVTGCNFIVSASQVIITHMRFRAGSHGLGQTDPDAVHAVVVQGGNPTPVIRNIIFDHCSMSWGIDETVDVAYNAQSVTFSWCIIGPGLANAGHTEGGHSAGLVLWGKYADPNQTVSAHHCFFPNNHFRDPEIGSGVTADLRNNVAYNWHSALSPQFNHQHGLSHSYVNFVHNYSRGGPDGPCASGNNSEMFFCDNDDPESKCHAQAGNAYPAIYYAGNLGCARTSQEENDWQIVTGWSPIQWLSPDWRASTPFTVSGVAVNHTSMSDAYASEIVAAAGATKPSRDPIDAGLANDFENGTELFKPDNVACPDDYPAFDSPEAPSDTDKDGMPDAWETARGLNPNLDDSALDDDGDGYTNIEEYLHEKA